MTQAISDNEAIGRIRGGDASSYEVLADRYHRYLHRIAKRLAWNEADAEDAVQEAHLRAFTKIDQYAGRSSYCTWMHSIVVNELRTQMRRRRLYIETCETDTSAIASTTLNPEQQASNHEIGRILQEAVNCLSPTYRPVFQLREMEQLSTAETGRRLSLSTMCVKSRLSRAKSFLRRELAGMLSAHASTTSPKPLKISSFPGKPAA